MRWLRATFFRWLPLAGLATAMCLLIYLAFQQSGRQVANDPQIQIARGAAYALAAGHSIDSVVPAAIVELTHDPNPFISVLDDRGEILASSARLHGQPRAIPAGVLDQVRRDGEEHVTWQPEPGVRMATVVVRTGGPKAGFVAVGRSLDDTEYRAEQFRNLVGVGWGLTLVGLLVLVSISEYFAESRSRT